MQEGSVTPLISVIVRSKNSESTIGATLSYLRAEETPVAIIVVDSGSTDRTLTIAAEYGAEIISINPEPFSFGGALNIGAAAAKTPFIAALSSHSIPHEPGWLACGLRYLQMPNVVAACGGRVGPQGERLPPGFRQDITIARAMPDWGFSNTGSFWRADIWERFPFDESLEASEDKEWALRVLSEGYEIAYDERLTVSSKHRETQGLRSTFKRHVREGQVSARVLGSAKYPVRDVIRHWWSGLPFETPPRMRRRFNPWRNAGIIGLFVGNRRGLRENAHATVERKVLSQ